MNGKITRRRLASAALGSGVAFRAAHAQTPAQAPPADLNAAAKEQGHKHSETLAKFDLPMSTEPAFQFKA